MAEQPNKTNISLVKLGMNKDTHPGQLNETQYTHAVNANVETESGNSLNVTNEKSNILITRYKPDFVVIGYENDILSNDTYVFLLNPITRVGEFGVIKDNQNVTNLDDITFNCGSNCEQAKELATPLEELTQVEIPGVYETLISDEYALNSATNTCYNIDDQEYLDLKLGFNFNINYPIKKITIKNEKCGKNIYFTDNFNSPRHINIDKIEQYYIQNVPCSDDLVTTCIDFDELRIFKLYNIPQITPTSIQLGGELKMGMYEFLLAYCDASGNEISPYYSLTRPISIFDKNNIIQGQENTADRTNFSIKLDVSGIDRRYSHYKVAVIQTADLEGTTRYFEEGIHTTNDNTVIYGSEQDKIATSIDKLLIDNLKVEQSEGLTASNNILFQYGLTLKKEINLQPVVNLMGQFLKWQTHIATETLYDNGVIGSKYIGYNRDEVVPFGIRFNLLGGYETAIFPFISRAPKESDLELLVDEDTGNAIGGNRDVKSILDNVLDCNTTNRTKRWQYYNTAEEENLNICESEDTEYITVETPITKVCILEDVIDVPAGNFVIELEDDEYTTLEEYIELKKDNCPNEFFDEEGNPSNLCYYLEQAENDDTICGEDLYASLVDENGDPICGIPTSEVEIELSKVFSPSSGSGQSGFVDGDNILERYSLPKGLAKDSSGNIYVVDTNNHAIRKITPSGAVSTFAGNGVPDFIDNNGVLARFKYPTSITIDSTNTFLYVSDTGNNAIRKIEISTGAVTTFVNSVSTTGITIDSSDNLYVTDTVNHIVKKIQPDTTISTLAGSGIPGLNDGNGTAATFRAPTGIIIDSTNTFLYVVDTGNNTIRKITLSGVVTTLVTSIPKLEQARGIAIDFSGNFYVTDTSKNSIRKITPLGVITDFVGSTLGASGSTDNTGTAATFNQPYGIIVDSSNDIYVADSGNNKIRKITLSGVVTTFSGEVTLPKFHAPRNTAVDSLGNIYITDSVNNSIRKVSTNGTVTTFAGSTSGTPGFGDATGTAATFNNPFGITIDSSDNLYVTELGNHSIRLITPSAVVTTLAGSGTPGSNDGIGTAATFSQPYGITIDSTSSFLYIADTGNHKIRKIQISTGTVTTFVGTGTPSFVNGNSTIATFHSPFGVTIAPDGKLYVSDSNNNAIRRVTTTGTVSTIVNSISKLEQPRGIVFDTANTLLYVVDTANHAIRKVTLSGTITDFAGTGTQGFVDESTVYSQFNQPFGITIDGANLYISDTGNNVIRKMDTTTGVVTTFAGYKVFTYVEGAKESKVEKIFPNEYQVVTSPSFCNIYKPSTSTGAFLIDPSAPLGYYCGVVQPTPPAPPINTIKEVYVRDSSFLNELCSNAEEIKNNNKVNPNDAATPFFNNYYVQSTAYVTTLAGSTDGNEDGEGTDAKFSSLIGMIADSLGNIYATDALTHSIRKITPSGEVTTFAGSTSGTQGSSDGIGTLAEFDTPYGITIDSSDNLYVIDTGNSAIRKITPAGVVSTFAINSFYADAFGITIDSNDTFLYFTDAVNNRVRRVQISTGTIITYTTWTTPAFSAAYPLNEPTGIAISNDNSTLYVVESQNNRIVEFSAAGSGVTNSVDVDFVTTSTTLGYANGTNTVARFNNPRGIKIDSAGNLYVADANNHAIRKIQISPTVKVTTIAGLGTTSGLDDGADWSARFKDPIDIAIVPSSEFLNYNTVYVADQGNDLIRKISSTPESLLNYTKLSTNTSPIPLTVADVLFYPQLSKNAIWFKGDTEGKNRFILDLSIQKDVDGDDFISVNSYVRLNLFKKCADNQAIYSKLVNLSNPSGAGMFLFEKKNSADLLITDLEGNSTLITGGWFANKKFLISIDTPIAYMEKELEQTICANSNKIGVWVNSPTDGCFTLTKRDIEYSRIFVSWSNIKLSKKIIYTAICNFSEPIPQSCKAIPYKIGIPSFWESEQTYPDNNELYNSSELLIKQERIEGTITNPSKLSEETIQEFLDVFTDGIDDGNYIFKSEPWQDTTKKVADFTCRNIRHFKFPDNKIAPFIYNQIKSPLSESIIYPIGITIDENVINTFLDIAVDNNLLSQEDRKKIVSYEIFRGDISLDRSVVASGLLFDMRRYSENNREVYYSNYPYNTYSKDILNLDSLIVPDSRGASWGNSNRNYTFHSPETDYGKPTLPSEMSVQGFMFGNSSGHFDEVKQHPKWVILSNSAYSLANSLALLEITAEAIVKTAEVLAAGSGAYIYGFTAYFGWSSGVGVTSNVPGSILSTFASASVAILSTVSAVVYKYGRFRYEWLKIFRDLGSPQNFAYYYYSEGFYNYMDKEEVELGNSIRALNIAKYLNDGRYSVTNEVTRENFKVNNIDRERSVLLSTGNSLITYPDVYKAYDKDDSSLATMSSSGLSQTSRSSEITKFIASPYVALKNYLPSQYNTINSIKWLTTSFVGSFTNINNDCVKILPIFGGDTFITRHSFKRKIPLFLVTAMKQADLTPFNYFYYSNIGRNPKYYVSYEQNKDFSSSGKTFPDIRSDFNFDNSNTSGNYYAPPSKFYLYYYGVPNFLTETRINTNYRYSGKEKRESFYPACGDLGEWTQESVVPIREPNIFKYNPVYSKKSTFIRSRTLKPTYKKEFDNCIQDMPNGIMASLPDSTENSIYDPWLIYRPLDTFEFPTNYGKLKDIIDVESGAILARFDNTSVLYNKVDTKIDTGSAITATVLGGNMFFQRQTTSFVNSKIGYGGTQNFASVSCEAGHFWVDAKRGQVLMVPPNGVGIQEISSQIGGKPSGLRNWFKEHLPFKILKFIPNADVDNPYNGVGITMGWDSRYRRVFITKKDYIPKPCVRFFEGAGYFCVDEFGEVVGETPISVTNTEYFEDVSWTISFSLNTGSWMSYYSFHPNYYISHNTYFQTGKNNAVDSSELGLWSHLLTNRSYQVFYGKKYPFVVEYPVKSEYTNKRLGSVKLWTEAKRYANEYDFSTTPTLTFNKSMIYNNIGCSGQLLLDVQEPNLFKVKDYPKTNLDGTQSILVTNKDNYQFTYDYIFNRIKYNTRNIPFLLQDKNQIEKTPNPEVVKFYGINPLKKMEGDWFLNRLTYDSDSRFSMTLKFVVNESRNA